MSALDFVPVGATEVSSPLSLVPVYFNQYLGSLGALGGGGIADWLLAFAGVGQVGQEGLVQEAEGLRVLLVAGGRRAAITMPQRTII